MRLRGKVRVVQGSNVGLTDATTPQRSAGAEAIVAEAMRTDTDLPLFVTLGAGLTELASAYSDRAADRRPAHGGLDRRPRVPRARPSPGAAGRRARTRVQPQHRHQGGAGRLQRLHDPHLAGPPQRVPPGAREHDRAGRPRPLQRQGRRSPLRRRCCGSTARGELRAQPGRDLHPRRQPPGPADGAAVPVRGQHVVERVRAASRSAHQRRRHVHPAVRRTPDPRVHAPRRASDVRRRRARSLPRPEIDAAAVDLAHCDSLDAAVAALDDELDVKDPDHAALGEVEQLCEAAPDDLPAGNTTASMAIAVTLLLTKRRVGALDLRLRWEPGGGPPERGIPTRGAVISVYALCGFAAGARRPCSPPAARRSGSPNFGELAELDSIAAVIIGGAAFAGGRGNVGQRADRRVR